MKANIISIGDELLIGQVINSNATFIAAELTKIGFKVNTQIAVGDQAEAINQALTNSLNSVDLVVLTGGIGPTKDDKTKEVLCDYFEDKLVLNEFALTNLKEVLGRRGISEISETNHRQAELPSRCKPLKNKLGTACGMVFEKQDKVVIALPGVPYEMETLMRDEVVPFLQEKTAFATSIFHRTLMVHGVPEARLSDELEDFEAALPQGVSLAYLPNHGIIRLRLTGFNSAKEIDEQFIKLSETVKPYLVALEDLPYEQIIGNLLKQKRATIAVSESCTGGYLSHLLTKHAGSSAFFKGSLVAYQNEVKSEILQVRKELLKKHGAVSELVVRDMALNTLQMFDADYAIAVSGIAGPDGATPDKPVGTVWIAAASSKRLATKLLQTSGTRQVIIVRAVYAALNLLQKEILENEILKPVNNGRE